MQSDILSVWSICSLLETMNKPLSHIKLKEIWERQRTDRRINNANSFSLPNERERDKQNQKKSLRLTEGQWPLCCKISPDYHLSVITNHCTLFLIIGQWPWHCAISLNDRSMTLTLRNLITNQSNNSMLTSLGNTHLNQPIRDFVTGPRKPISTHDSGHSGIQFLNSFPGLPCLELVSLRSKTLGSAYYWKVLG